MNYTLTEIFSYSVGISAVIGLLRLSRIERVYLPFILLLCTGLLNEIVSTVSINLFNTNALNSNIYVLLESLLIVWFFYNLGLFRRPAFFWGTLAVFAAAWAVDNFVLSGIYRFNSYFRIVYSFVVVLMSIHMINELIPASRGWLVKNPVFLITTGFIIFFTYKALVEIFWLWGLNASKDFRVEVYRIMAYINLSVNLIYLLAVLWIPRKREYTWL